MEGEKHIENHLGEVREPEKEGKHLLLIFHELKLHATLLVLLAKENGN